MTFFCSIEKSTTGTIVRKITERILAAPPPSCTANRQVSQAQDGVYTHQMARKQSAPQAVDISTSFVNALVAAGRCRVHSQSNIYDRPLRLRSRFGTSNTCFSSRVGISQRRLRHRKAGEVEEPDPQDSDVPTIAEAALWKRFEERKQHEEEFSEYDQLEGQKTSSTKEELLALVDQYDTPTPTDHLPLLGLPDLRQPSIGPMFDIVPDTAEESQWPSKAYVWPAHGQDQINLRKLEAALRIRSFHPEDLFKLYRSLPAPRVPYLLWKVRGQLLKQLSVVEKRDERSMLRYLAVIDDMKACTIPLQSWQWNIAIGFASRYVTKTTDMEVHAGLSLWREMDNLGSVQSNTATFNILFDAATKAGKFKLAELILKEMECRGIRFNRFHHVSLMHFNGLKGDGDGVRAAYKNLVEAGEVVDTVVLNCLMSSLIKAGEPQPAELVYARMKAMHDKRTDKTLPPRDYYPRRKIDRSLVSLAVQARKDPSQMYKVQDLSTIAPDSQTYHIMVNHIALTVGDMRQTAKLLDEMRSYKVPLRGGMFVVLFKAFGKHGGLRYSQWSDKRLESVWCSFIEALAVKQDGLYLGRWALAHALFAFHKVCGKARAIQIWEEAQKIWTPSNHGEEDHVIGIVRRISETKQEWHNTPHSDQDQN